MKKNGKKPKARANAKAKTINAKTENPKTKAMKKKASAGAKKSVAKKIKPVSKKIAKPRGSSQRTPINSSHARVEIRRLLIALNRTNQRDKVGLANLRDEVNDFADKLRKSSPDAYTEFELEIKLIYERVFNKLTGEHVFVE